MLIEKAERSIGVKDRQSGWVILRQRNVWGLARVVGPRIRVIKIINRKRLQIDLEKKVYIGGVMASELDCNTCESG